MCSAATVPHGQPGPRLGTGHSLRGRPGGRSEGNGADAQPRDTAHQATGETRPPPTSGWCWRSGQSAVPGDSAGEPLPARGSAQGPRDGGSSAPTRARRLSAARQALCSSGQLPRVTVSRQPW